MKLQESREIFKGMHNKSFQLDKEASKNLKGIFPENHNFVAKSEKG